MILDRIEEILETPIEPFVKKLWNKIKPIALRPVRYPEAIVTTVLFLISVASYFILSPYFGTLYLNYNAHLDYNIVSWGFLASFMHGSLSHLAYNMFVTLPCMLIIEKKMGPWHCIATYIFCGVLGNIVQTHFLGPDVIGIGSSTATFGLVPIALCLMTSGFSRIIIISLLTVLCLESAVWWQPTGVGHLAHVGGMLCGLLYCFMVVLRRKGRFCRDNY